MKPTEKISIEEARKLLAKPKRYSNVSQRIAARKKSKVVSKAKAGRT